ncbi:hypothetical protein D3C81_2090330 [compost metagenome]
MALALVSPISRDGVLLLQPFQGQIQCGLLNFECPFRAFFDGFGNFVPVVVLRVQNRQNQQVDGAFQHFRVQRGSPPHCLPNNVKYIVIIMKDT